MALWAVERAERHGLATVVAIANGFNDGRGGHGLRLGASGCGRQCRRAVLKRTDYIDFWRAGLLPGEADADEQDYKADCAVERILQFKKRRSQT